MSTGRQGALACRGRLLIPLGIFLVALLPRMVFLHQLRGSPTFHRPEGGDSIFYDRVAAGEPEQPRAYFHSPLYRWFLRGIYLGAGRSLVLVRLLQHLLGATAALLVYLVTLRLFCRRPVAITAALLAGLYGPAIFYEGQLLPDAILPFLLAASALVLVRYAQQPRPWRALLLGLMLGLTALGRPTSLLWLPAIIIWAVVLQLRARRAVSDPRARPALQGRLPASPAVSDPRDRPALQGRPPASRAWRPMLWRQGLLLFGTVLVISPVTLRNYLVERDLVPITTNGGLNLYIGNNPNARGTYNLPAGVWFKPGDPGDDFAGRKAATRAVGRELTSAELGRWWRDRALSYLRDNPRHGLQLVWNKVRLWVSDYEFPQLYSYYGYRLVCPVLWLLPTAGFIIAPALAGLVFLCWYTRRRVPRLLALCVLLSAVGYLPFFVVGRYRAAWIVLVAPFAGLALATLGRSLRATFRARAQTTVHALGPLSRGGSPPRARPRQLAGLAGALAAGALVCFWPVVGRPTLAPQLYAFGNAALARRDLRQAERWYRRTIDEEPGHRAVEARLGRALLEQGRVREALAVLQRGRSLSPRSAAIRLVQGLAHHRVGDLRRAERDLLDAVRLSPGMAQAWIELAEVKAGLGRTAEAIRAYRSALVMASAGEPWVPRVRRRLAELQRQLERP